MWPQAEEGRRHWKRRGGVCLGPVEGVALQHLDFHLLILDLDFWPPELQRQYTSVVSGPAVLAHSGPGIHAQRCPPGSGHQEEPDTEELKTILT